MTWSYIIIGLWAGALLPMQAAINAQLRNSCCSICPDLEVLPEFSADSGRAMLWDQLRYSLDSNRGVSFFGDLRVNVRPLGRAASTERRGDTVRRAVPRPTSVREVDWATKRLTTELQRRSRNMSSPLFDPFELGPYMLKNRIVMAPLTRSRSRQPGNIPTRLNAYYYAQRASAGLIISEATQVSQQGQGYAWTPGIHTTEQVEGWRLVTEAVHAAGGLIFMQLWHVGRVSHPALQQDGRLPVAPSAIPLQGMAFITNEKGEPEFAPFVTPRALELEEIPDIVRQYAEGARNAMAAGFDGVEVHSANGYLLDQFLNSSTNHRSDDYGGSPENRARLLCEVVQAVCGVWGSDRVGVRLSPKGTFNDMGDDDPETLFAYVAKRLNDFALAYLHLVQPEIAGNATVEWVDRSSRSIIKMIREIYRGTLMVCGGYDYRKATRSLEIEGFDLIAFGRLFLANPDLPDRLRQSAPLNKPDEATFYGGGAQGYIDYPTLRQQRGEVPMPDLGHLEKSLLGTN